MRRRSRGGIELQFFGLRQYEPAESVSTCYVLTDDVDGLRAAFRAGLKAAYGRIPTRGLPRIGQLEDMSYGVRQFLMSDPGGNCARALHHASLLADSKEDPAGAAKVIDRVLRLPGERPTPVQTFRLLVLRADVAGRRTGIGSGRPRASRRAA